jgi:hypothetical protein
LLALGIAFHRERGLMSDFFTITCQTA